MTAELDRVALEPPVIPVGTDAYLQWDRLAYHRIGVRAYMRSTFDRTGYNEGGDAGHFLYQESDTFNVVVDERGPGVLYFVRTNHQHGSPWHYEVDGEDFIVKETATDDPIDPYSKYQDPVFVPEDLFPHGLTHTWRETKGGDIMQVPIAFEKSLRYALSRTFYGTSYTILHKFASDSDHLSRPIRSWDHQPPDPAAPRFIESAGSNLLVGRDTNVVRGSAELGELPLQIPMPEGPTMVRAIRFSVSQRDAYDFGRARLRVTWDGAEHPSIDAPIALFFGVGHLFNVDDREMLSRGLLANVRYGTHDVELACYWPMPYFRGARVEIVPPAGTSQRTALTWHLETEPYVGAWNEVAYFHATYTEVPEAEEGKYICFLDTDTVEGGGPWGGHFVGLSWIFTHRGKVMRTVEGHPKFTFDDLGTPQGFGTGTEEFAGGGDHWRSAQHASCPLFGHPVGRMGGKPGDDPRELLNSAYRFLVADLFPFGRRARIEFKHADMNNSREHYEGVAFWYGVNDPSLTLTDVINPCSTERELHGLSSEGDQAPYALTSRFEQGPHEDFPEQLEFYPAETHDTRITLGSTEFDAALDASNLGVMLVRRFDYYFPNQCAKVSVLVNEEWQPVGEWYTAGSSTCVYSRPLHLPGTKFTEAELAPTEHNIRDSGKRWKEEEFLIPRSLTAGLDHIRIRIEHIPIERDLFPGHPFPARSAWSESEYRVYCYRLPRPAALG